MNVVVSLKALHLQVGDRLPATAHALIIKGKPAGGRDKDGGRDDVL
jgi:hypothetical protein